ncbi:MAG: asparagine synthase (glutamine-hydrolyzing) [Thermoflexales bacterium]
MCGITGLYFPNTSPDLALLQQMNRALIHRGPDGEGYFNEGPVRLAMRRLAVIDLQTGDQPIFNEDHSVAVVYNGEIYNYRELRAELERLGHRFVTQSDTEVLVHGYEAWGDDLPLRLNGMFAFALWDSRRKRLLLARDHLGIKPVYYAPLPNGGLAFASELKALLPVDSWSREIDPLALDWFLATRYIPSPRTIYLGVRKLPPAHRLIVGAGETLRIERYWDVAFIPNQEGNEQEWSERLRQSLTAAVRRQMIADVPLGAFLSGGIDSSIVVSLMAGASAEPLRTFTVTFPSWGDLDESRFARLVARRFGTVHAEIAVEADVEQEWRALANHMDEPFADPAALPTWLMARQTRSHVTVVLTGEGADELFQGYGWYRWPAPLLPSYFAEPLSRLIQRWWQGRRGRHRLIALLAPSFGALYVDGVLSSVSQAEQRASWYQPDWWAHLRAAAPRVDIEHLLRETSSRHRSSAMQELDVKIWLEGDPLTKVDRMTMLASLEARVPFLDKELVELASNIPIRYHQGKLSKWLLRRAFADLLPREVFERSKHAFDVPVGAWLRGPLRSCLEESLLGSSQLWQILRPELFVKMTEQHLSGQRDFSRELWVLLNLAFWWERRA